LGWANCRVIFCSGAGNTTFYFPLATSIIISLLLTLLLNLFLRR
jgi:hypothetical protein